MTTRKVSVTYSEVNGVRTASINGREVSPDHPKIKLFNAEMERIGTRMDDFWVEVGSSMRRISRAFRKWLGG
jgi:hypothetical protein